MNGTGAAPPKANEIERLFGRRRALVGMIHLGPLPGSPRYDRGAGMAEVHRRALDELAMLQDAGFDGVIVENGWDVPFLPPDEVGPETVAAMAAVVSTLTREATIPLGVNCLANAVEASLAVAAAGGAAFVRANQWVNAYVANEGVVEGRAGRVLRYRNAIGAQHVSVWADVGVKLGSHSITADRSLADQARDAEFFDADALIVTGSRLADPPILRDLIEVRKAVQLAVVVGSGVTPDNLVELFGDADAAIVGSSLKEGGVWWGELSPEAVARMAESREGIDNGTGPPPRGD